MIIKKKLILIILFLICVCEINAQINKPDTIKRHFINLNVGYDHNLIAVNLGYACHFPKFKTSAFIDFTQGSALFTTGNYRTQIGLQTWLGSFKKFNLKSSVAFVHTRSINNAGKYNGLGLNININAGLNIKRNGFGIDIQYNPYFATHIQHSAFWREFYFSDAKDGWYGFTTNNLRFGGYFTRQLSKKKTWEVNLRAGKQSSGQYDKLIPGFYFIIGLNKKI